MTIKIVLDFHTAQAESVVTTDDGLDTPRDYVPITPACIKRLPWLSQSAKHAYEIICRRHRAAQKRGKVGFRFTMDWLGGEMDKSIRTAERCCQELKGGEVEDGVPKNSVLLVSVRTGRSNWWRLLPLPEEALRYIREPGKKGRFSEVRSATFGGSDPPLLAGPQVQEIGVLSNLSTVPPDPAGSGHISTAKDEEKGRGKGKSAGKGNDGPQPADPDRLPSPPKDSPEGRRCLEEGIECLGASELTYAGKGLWDLLAGHGYGLSGSEQRVRPNWEAVARTVGNMILDCNDEMSWVNADNAPVILGSCADELAHRKNGRSKPGIIADQVRRGPYLNLVRDALEDLEEVEEAEDLEVEVEEVGSPF